MAITNAWGTDISLINANEFCIWCERETPRHYDNCNRSRHSMVKAPHDVIVDRSFVGIPATSDSIRVELNPFPAPGMIGQPTTPLVFA